MAQSEPEGPEGGPEGGVAGQGWGHSVGVDTGSPLQGDLGRRGGGSSGAAGVRGWWGIVGRQERRCLSCLGHPGALPLTPHARKGGWAQPGALGTPYTLTAP